MTGHFTPVGPGRRELQPHSSQSVTSSVLPVLIYMPGVLFSQSYGDLMIITPFESERAAIHIYSRTGDMNQD